MPGTKGLSGPADPGVGSRKQVPLCILPRHLSQPLRTHPSKQMDRRGSLLLFSLLPGFWLIHTVMRLFLKSLVSITGKHWELCPWSSLHAPFSERQGKSGLGQRKWQSQPQLPRTCA